jgi:hypothetical protein
MADGPIVPESDPHEPNAPKLVKRVMSHRPRLLFGPKDIPVLRKRSAGSGKAFFKQMEQYLPVCKRPKKPAFPTNATAGQRVGLWRMPTVALHYVITGEKTSFQQTVGYMKMLLEMDHWETGRERDSGMSSANVMIGAALAYDWLHDDLPKDFREAFGRKLLTMARRQYYGGHLNRNRSVGYWQCDPANNHRWHRDAGMVLATLAAYEGDAEDDWLLARCYDELAFVNKWLPEDGTSHEGPSYHIFGGAHLTLACQAADRCFGTEYLEGKWFRNAPSFRLHMTAPGFETSFHFGDSSGMGSYSNFLWKCAAAHELVNAQAGLEKHYTANPKAWWLGWMSLLWKDPALTGGSVKRLGHDAFFPDLGLATMRDTWAKGGVAATFKCGPLGGYRLNAYRNANRRKYVNVAHNDPDAGSFTIFAGGRLLAETDRYSKSKRSANHNTILVNGVGQTVRGRKEGAGWSQPGKGDDMSKMASVLAYRRAGEVVLVEGESAGAYPAIKGVRAALEQFRRTLIWVEGKYILVADDIRATKPVTITWLVQGPQLSPDRRGGIHHLSGGASTCPMHLRYAGKGGLRIVDSPADHRGKPLGWKQLRLTQKTAATRVVSVYDPWNVGLSLQWRKATDDAPATVTVRGRKFSDVWTWRPPKGRVGPTQWLGRRGKETLIRVKASHKPPQP